MRKGIHSITQRGEQEDARNIMLDRTQYYARMELKVPLFLKTVPFRALHPEDNQAEPNLENL